MIWLYRLAFWPVLLCLAPIYLWRMWKRGGYGRDFGHRLGAVPGLGPVPAGKQRLWVQAVSVGELLALAPLLRRWTANPALEIVLTTTTSTGYALARERYGDKVAAVAQFPLDWWLLSRRAWRRLRPTAIVLMEAELWPEHLHQARQRGVPAILLNARLSDRSRRRYARFPWVARRLYGKLAAIAASGASDAARLAELGVPSERLEVVGNLKFDVVDAAEAERLEGGAAALRAECRWAAATSGRGLLVLLGSSTWPGEEAALLGALQELRERDGLDEVRLLLVPRHAERRAEVAAAIAATGLPWAQRSKAAGPGAPVVVYLADTTGELRRLTATAEIVFVGKSLAPHTEGQSPIEAAALGRPIVFGPGMSNFREAAPGLVAAGAAQIVTDPAALTAALRRLVTDTAARAAAAAAARQWAQANQGATDRAAAIVERVLAGR